MTQPAPLYRISFVNQGKVYEVFAREVGQSDMMGFIEIAGFEFGKRSSVVVDPGEETLRSEFEGVERTFVPLHAVVRIDRVAEGGSARITELGEGAGKVTPFPVFAPGPEKS